MVEVFLAINFEREAVFARMSRPVLVVVHGFHIIIRNNSLIGAGNQRFYRMCCQSCCVPLLTDVFDHFMNHFNFIVAHQPVAPVTLDLNDVHPKIDGFINILKIEFFVRIRADLRKFTVIQVGPDLRYNLDFAAGNLFVFGQKRIRWKSDIDGVDSGKFCQLKRLINLLFGIVSFEKFRDIDQVARMCPAANQVSTGN